MYVKARTVEALLYIVLLWNATDAVTQIRAKRQIRTETKSAVAAPQNLTAEQDNFAEAVTQTRTKRQAKTKTKSAAAAPEKLTAEQDKFAERVTDKYEDAIAHGQLEESYLRQQVQGFEMSPDIVTPKGTKHKRFTFSGEITMDQANQRVRALLDLENGMADLTGIHEVVMKLGESTNPFTYEFKVSFASFLICRQLCRTTDHLWTLNVHLGWPEFGVCEHTFANLFSKLGTNPRQNLLAICKV